MSAMGAQAVIPIKRFERGKTRLRERLSDVARAELSQSMFERVLHASLACAELDGALVLTDAPEIARDVRARGADVLEDPETLLLEDTPSPSLTAARLGTLIDLAFSHLRARGVGVALVLMADLPRVEPSDLTALLAALDGADLALAPDLRGECTNALALRFGPAANRFRTAFGGPGSLELHAKSARELGLRVRIEENPRLGLDLDVPADLDLLAGLHQDS
jgi:2-phospho-L-lactate/phosphoenolpyruvate guanylyltransferase